MHLSLLSTSVAVLRLRSEYASAEIAPWIGGAIASYRWDLDDSRLDWLRPASTEALISGDAENVSCFPLVPYSNRVRNGRFQFGGREIRLNVDPLNPHFEHGHGWRAPWKIADVCSDGAVLTYTHEPDSWPWSYLAEQHITLSKAALSVTLTVTNQSDEPMPCGLGLHPYFPRTPNTRLKASVEKMWVTDAEVLSLRAELCAPEADPSLGLAVADAALDNAFTGWNGSAEIVWPERKAALIIEAEAPLRVLVVYTPRDADFFCAEPVSNITDAFNMPEESNKTGLIVLEAGKSARATTRFLPRTETII
jgi:aldose 1-epimerase